MKTKYCNAILLLILLLASLVPLELAARPLRREATSKGAGKGNVAATTYDYDDNGDQPEPIPYPSANVPYIGSSYPSPNTFQP